MKRRVAVRSRRSKPPPPPARVPPRPARYFPTASRRARISLNAPVLMILFIVVR